MSEETTQVAPEVVEAAGMTADDLISQWANQEDEKENTDAETQVEGEAEVADENKEEGDSGETGEAEATEDRESGTTGESGVDNPKGQTAPTGSEEPAADSTPPKTADARVGVSDNVAPAPLDDFDKLIEETDLFDPDQSKKLLKTLASTIKSQQDVIEQSRAVTQAAQVEKYWADYAAQNPDVGATGRKLWDEAIAKHKQRGLTGPSLQAAAEAEWEIRVEQAKGAAKARAAKVEPVKPQPKVTPGAARVTPQATRTKPPYTPKTAEEKLMAGQYGDLTRLIED